MFRYFGLSTFLYIDIIVYRPCYYDVLFLIPTCRHDRERFYIHKNNLLSNSILTKTKIILFFLGDFLKLIKAALDAIGKVYGYL